MTNHLGKKHHQAEGYSDGQHNKVFSADTLKEQVISR